MKPHPPLWLCAALASIACATPPVGVSLVTQTEYTDVERGPGVEHCAEMEQAASLIEAERLPEAEALVDTMLARFEADIAAADGIPLSVANQKEFDQVRAGAADPDRLVPLDWCFREVLHWKAFLRAGQGDYAGALSVLAQQARIAPTAAAPFVERGYILNRLHRVAEARRSYERALELTEQFPASAPLRPMALRGLGYALIELGDLDGADDAFSRSLHLEPGNELALRELRYIEMLRAKQR